MGKDDNAQLRPLRLGLIARAIGLLAAGFWILVLIGRVVSGESGEIDGQLAIFYGLIGAAAFGVGYTFRDEMMGGALTFTAGLVIAVLATATPSRSQLMALLSSGLPFVVAGALSIVSASGSSPPSDTVTARSESPRSSPDS